MEHTIEDHDITLKFPRGLVAQGQTLQLEVAVAMYGPFKFADDIQPISPLLWLCPLDESTTELNKPFQIILPHFLSGNKVQDHKVGFVKANHRDCEGNCYIFNVCHTKPDFLSTGSKSYGILETNHCCFYCLEAKISPDMAKDAKYYLYIFQRISGSRQELYFCAIYFLKTCIKVCLLYYIKYFVEALQLWILLV